MPLDVFMISKDHLEIDVSKCICTKRRELFAQFTKLPKLKSPNRRVRKTPSTVLSPTKLSKAGVKGNKNKSPKDKEIKSPQLKTNQRQKKQSVDKNEDETSKVIPTPVLV